MKTLDQLINLEDPAWPILDGLIRDATNRVSVLPRVQHAAEEALTFLQVTTRSFLGAVAFETGGLIINGGMLRVFGSGGASTGSIAVWNTGATKIDRALLVAQDAFGGLFALNGGGLGATLGEVFYLAPDTLDWEEMGDSYSSFIDFCFAGDLSQFFSSFQWDDADAELRVLPLDQVYSFYPPPWSAEFSIGGSDRRAIPAQEHAAMTLEIKTQLQQEQQ